VEEGERVHRRRPRDVDGTDVGENLASVVRVVAGSRRLVGQWR
jgi:hypothetical protein